jgi:hypothetical protein
MKAAMMAQPSKSRGHEAEWFRRVMIDKQITQAALAREVGLSTTRIGTILRRYQRTLPPEDRYRDFSKSTAERDAYSIQEFCDRHTISHGTYYNMKKRGLGPREGHVMGRVIITKEAAADWRRAIEKAAITTEPTIAVDVEFLDRRLDSLDFGKGFTARARHAFATHSVYDTDLRNHKTIPLVTVRDLVAVSKAELWREPNLGLKTIERVEAVLAAHGLRLAP